MWEQIRSNQIRSVILVAGMAVLLLLVGYFLGLIFFDSGIAGLVIALIIWAIMNLVAYFQGDSILLALSGARRIERDDHPRLYNIVEEMKIASGLEHMPDIYIIEDRALNAFATGRNPERASVAITSGLLQKLNRDELQGVIGHEIAHIKNRDVLLMAICSILLGTIVILAWYASRVFLYGALFGGGGRRSSSGGGGAQLIVIAVAIVLIIVAPIIAQFIYFAISRKREYLADASSAQYTRYPEGLASALEKIGRSGVQLQSANKASAPMYIVNPFRKKGISFTDLSSTHPPLSERIRILRSMAGGASFVDYDTAYREVHRGSVGIIPTKAFTAAGAVPLRSPTTEAIPAPRRIPVPGRPAPLEPEPTKLERTREVTDLLWRKSNYRTIVCACGTKMKLPAKLGVSQVKCPHCGRTNTV
ncbi:MAG TPA: M48 family metallopeptidase [Dehalococcoidia bacterium]|nr:M48 family metallopeptidase [Dehalococcoidia bacterium]